MDRRSLSEALFEGVSLWDVGRQERIGAPFGVSAETGEVLTRMAMSPDGTTLVLATLAPDGSALVTVWDLASLTPVGEPIRPAHAVTSLAFSQDGATLAVGSEDASVTVWDLTMRQQLFESMEGHAGPVTGVAFKPRRVTRSPRRARTVTLSSGTYRRRGRTLRLLASPSPARRLSSSDIAFSPDGSLLAAASSSPSPDPERPSASSEIRLWDAVSGEPLGVALEGSAEEPVVAFSVDGGLLAGATASDTVELWNVASAARKVAPLQEEGTYIKDVEFSPDGTLLAALRAERLPDPRSDALALGDPEVRLWALDSFEPAGEPFAEESERVAFSPDGRGLFVADGRLRLWEHERYSAFGAGSRRGRGDAVRVQPRREEARHIRYRRHDPLGPRERLGSRQREPPG